MTEKAPAKTPEERAAWHAKMKAAKALKRAAAAESTVIVEKSPKPKPAAKPLRKPAPTPEASPEDGGDDDWIL